MKKHEKNAPKSSILKQKFGRFRNFHFTAQQNSYSQMWPIEQLYLETTKFAQLAQK